MTEGLGGATGVIFTVIPWFQINFLPFLMHVYLTLLIIFIAFIVVHLVPAILVADEI